MNNINLFKGECRKQSNLHRDLLDQGFQLVEDPANLYQHIGTVQEVQVIFSEKTPKLLAKLFVVGTEHLEHGFHLVPLHQIVKWQMQYPSVGDTFTGEFIIGVRKVSEQGYVPALRLPQKDFQRPHSFKNPVVNQCVKILTGLKGRALDEALEELNSIQKWYTKNG